MREWERLTAEVAAAGARGAVTGRDTSDALLAPILVGSVVRSTADGWEVQDLTSAERVVSVRGWVRLLVQSAGDTTGRSLQPGTIVMCAERSGEFLLIGRPGLYS